MQQFDYNEMKAIGFCEACVGGKHQRGRFENSETQTKEVLELVHSDVCGKMHHRLIGGAEYFVSFSQMTSHATLGSIPLRPRIKCSAAS